MSGFAEPDGTATPSTVNGLPVRVPQTTLPKEARRRTGAPAPGTRDEQSTDDPDIGQSTEIFAAPADRDPERVAATMAAYARGLTGRAGGGPKP